jgi:hypothetical protein
MKRGREEQHNAAEGIERIGETMDVFALGYDAHVVFQGEHTGSPCPEDRLVVGKDDSVHLVMFSCGNGFAVRPLIGKLAPGTHYVYNPDSICIVSNAFAPPAGIPEPHRREDESNLRICRAETSVAVTDRGPRIKIF